MAIDQDFEKWFRERWGEKELSIRLNLRNRFESVYSFEVLAYAFAVGKGIGLLQAREGFSRRLKSGVSTRRNKNDVALGAPARKEEE